MKHLKIRNVGPLKNVDIELKRINVIIGPQSYGKSCILKIACYCTWVEKRIEIEQSDKRFKENDGFVSELVRFHKLEGYMHDDSYIEYESDLMRFQYDATTKKFDFEWNKKNRWEYKRSKICYIPAERNMVAAIPNWYEVKFPDNNIFNFMKDWEIARKTIGDFSVLNFDISYHYDSALRKDEVRVTDNVTLDFTNTSSGFQSLIPICGLLQYFFETQFLKETHESVATELEKEEILKHIYQERYEAKVKNPPLPQKKEGNKTTESPTLFFRRFGNVAVAFYYKSDADKCQKYYTNYTTTDHSDMFLEEPELNLFPQTQHDLVNWLVEKANGERKHNLFIATHSPYIVTSINNLLEAGNVVADAKGKCKAVEQIVPKGRILSYKDVGAFTIRDGEVCPIMDKRSKLISAEEIDKASDIIDEEFNELLWL